MNTYQIRTRAGAPVFEYDTLSRAKEEIARAEKRVGVPMKLVEITRTEREIKL